MKIGRITLSDRAFAKVYDDQSGPEIERVVGNFFKGEHEWVRSLLPDDGQEIKKRLIELCDIEKCPLVITTGGTGLSTRDVTPDATLQILEKELPGFGEVMRRVSFEKVPTAILSRATAGIRGKTLIINLPGKPSSIEVCLQPLVLAIQDALRHLAE